MLSAQSDQRSPLAEVIALPEFKVVSDRPLPPREEWKYVKLGNFEVLSSASERTTKEFVKDLREFQIVLSTVAPEMMIQAELPVMVVLCGKMGQFDRFEVKRATRSISGLGTSLVRDNEIASIVVDYTYRALGDEVDIMTSFGRFFGRKEVHTSQEFIRQYVHLALSRLTPRMPAWVAEGMANIYSDIDYNNKWIEVGMPKSFRNEYTMDYGTNFAGGGFGGGGFGYGQNSWMGYGSSPYSTDSGMPNYGAGSMSNAAPRVYVQPIYIMPMDKMFAVGYDSPTITGAKGVSMADWRKQTTAFVHMCLYGHQGRYQKAFLKFVTMSAKQEPTEALFKECFGKTYKQMALEIRSYSEFTVYTSKIYKPTNKGESIFLPAPAIAVRPATDGEIGRIKGETLRLAGQDEAARNEFVVAYLRGDRDPQLLASLGLMARQRHDDKRARTYLEAVAVAPATIPRPRAYLELARVRYAQQQAAKGGAPLDLNELVAVLEPLFVGQKLPQQLAENYLEVARAWQNTTVVPQRDHIAVVERGINLFPRNGTLVVAAASLLIKNGYKAEAAPLIERTLNATRDPLLKAELEKLQAQIGTTPTTGE